MTLFGIVMLSSEEHSEKAFLPIFVTVSGIVILVSKEHFQNAFSPISVKPSGMITSSTSIEPVHLKTRFDHIV